MCLGRIYTLPQKIISKIQVHDSQYMNKYKRYEAYSHYCEGFCKTHELDCQ